MSKGGSEAGKQTTSHPQPSTNPKSQEVSTMACKILSAPVDPTEQFGKLQAGDTFTNGGVVFLKISSIGSANAVAVATGMPKAFSPADGVLVCDVELRVKAKPKPKPAAPSPVK